MLTLERLLHCVTVTYFPQSLLDLHGVASDKNDAHLCDFLESTFLTEQVEGIKELADLATKLRRAGDGLGTHIIDKEMASQ